MLALERVGKTYPNGVHALERFSADIRLGEIVAIIGGSGCGKSTLLRAIAGLDRATTGTVTLDHTAITAPHAKIGIIFQEPRLLPWLSVADNIGFGLSELPANVRREKVARALARVGLTDKANAWPRELSGGQAQRVAIARALVPQPEVLLLDEPFSALDAFTRRDLQDHLLDLWNDTRPTLILVTHDVDEAVVLADRVLVMRPRPGRLFEEIKINLARPRDRNSPLFDNFKRRVLTALDRVGLTDKAKVWPRELSGGQAQRVAIARALVPRPQVLLLDEPFSALDAFTRVDLQDHLLNLWNEFKPTLVMVTHDVEEAIALADRIVVMRPHPGQVADEIEIDLPRPRDRQSAAFDFAKRRVLAALDRSLDRAVRAEHPEQKAAQGAAMWW